jgi:hypothetical protein
LHDAPGELAKLLGLAHDIGVAFFEFAGAGLDLGVQRVRKLLVLLPAAS